MRMREAMKGQDAPGRRVGSALLVLLLAIAVGSVPACVTGGPSGGAKSAAGADDQIRLSERHLDFAKWGRTNQCCVAEGKRYAIASGGSRSSKCGEEVIEHGGNLIDAAVATAFCLAVERPHSVSIAGGGFMLLHLSKGPERDVFIDFRETAPARATRGMFLDGKGQPVPDLNRNGALAVATPGFIAGLHDAQTKYGRLKGSKGWAAVLAPAINLARAGFPVYPSLAEKIAIRKDVLAKDENLSRLLLHGGAESLKVGERLVQVELAQTLELIAKDGPAVFYMGKLGKKIAQRVTAKGGVLTLSDLRDYRVRLRRPLVASFHGHTIVTAPPPSAGGVLLLESLKILEGMALQAQTPYSEYLHLLGETFKRTFADRFLNVADPDFSKSDPASRLRDDYILAARTSIKPDVAHPASSIKPGEGRKNESPDTTQLSLIDAEGNAVSATITMNYFFGAAVMVPGTGIILNDEMGDFAPKDDGSENTVAPKRRPVSSMAPTIVLDGGAPVMSLGAAGGPYIVTGLAQVILNHFVLGWSLRDSQFAPRLHHQWSPDKLFLEPNGFDERTAANLRRLGHEVAPPALYAQVQLAGSGPLAGTVVGVIDPRDEGGAVAH